MRSPTNGADIGPDQRRRQRRDAVDERCHGHAEDLDAGDRETAAVRLDCRLVSWTSSPQLSPACIEPVGDRLVGARARFG
jgi:hypothetical protein